jgi:hypothetical protein
MVQDSSSLVPATAKRSLASFRARLESDGSNAGVRSLQRQLDILHGELQREQNLRNTDRQRHDQVGICSMEKTQNELLYVNVRL